MIKKNNITITLPKDVAIILQEHMKDILGNCTPYNEIADSKLIEMANLVQKQISKYLGEKPTTSYYSKTRNIIAGRTVATEEDIARIYCKK